MTAQMLLKPGKQSKLSVPHQFILASCSVRILHTSCIMLCALPPTACSVLQVWRRPAACAHQSAVHRHSYTLSSSSQPVCLQCLGCSCTFQQFSTSGITTMPDQTTVITAARAAATASAAAAAATATATAAAAAAWHCDQEPVPCRPALPSSGLS